MIECCEEQGEVQELFQIRGDQGEITATAMNEMWLEPGSKQNRFKEYYWGEKEHNWLLTKME